MVKSTKSKSSPTKSPQKPNLVSKSKSKTIKKHSQFPLAITSSEIGHIFVVGSGDCGQLGLGPDVFEKSRPGKISYFDELEIVDIFAGGLHSIALSKTGKLYSWGCNDQKALGRDGEETEPGQVHGLDGVFIVSVSCGDSATMALANTGHVYAWGTFRGSNGIFGFSPGIEVQPIPKLIAGLNNITQISCGTNHMICIQDDGKIYTWGIGEQGQLGRKVMSRHALDASLIPRPINFRPYRRTAKFKSVFTGGYHSVLLHESNELFSFGLNNYGQLGLGDLVDHDIPDLVEGLQKEEIKSVGGGEHFTVILQKDGKVYCCGRNDSSQLGLDLEKYPEHSSEATLLSILPPVQQISCGSAFTLAVTKDNDLYAWGYGEMGQLANEGEDAPTPFKIELKDRKVLGAAAGGQHTVLLLAPKD